MLLSIGQGAEFALLSDYLRSKYHSINVNFTYCCQFHQHFMREFRADILAAKNYKAEGK
jgi:hypothetical protein